MEGGQAWRRQRQAQARRPQPNDAPAFGAEQGSPREQNMKREGGGGTELLASHGGIYLRGFLGKG